MEFTGVGGGVMLAIAAALWLVYLVPNWFKQREYLATERNAVRLQQTIRVLAETAEIPDAVRAEVAARRVALQQRADLLTGPVSVGAPVRRDIGARELRAQRLRRTRLAASALLLAALTLTVVQAVVMIVGGAVVSSWVVLAICGVAAIGSLALLGRLSTARIAREAAPARARRTTLDPYRATAPAEPRNAAWTPVALPKPMYLQRRARAPIARSAVDAAVELELAAIEAGRALRAAQASATPIAAARDTPRYLSPEILPASTVSPVLQPVSAVPPADSPEMRATPSRFVRMGYVDAAPVARPNLDEVLARRRA